MLHFTLFVSSFIAFTNAAATPSPQLYSPLISSKVRIIAQGQPSPPTYPQFTDSSAGKWQDFAPNTWTSGFFPATLYALNTRAKLCGTTDGDGWVALGRQWSTGLIPLEMQNTLGHDVGFVSMPFVEEYNINPANQTAVAAIQAFAASLDARFSSVVGCTRSWDTDDSNNFEVIIDNMMNLELLFIGEEMTGNHVYRQHAISHADKTMQNHVRADGSSYHLVTYDAHNGDVTFQGTVQGYADNSTWSRGQAWGIYGFANMFQHTHDPNYLTTARRMATYFVQNIPSDGIVPWDFNAPLEPSRPADTSAATVAATGLLLLAQMEMSLSPANTTGRDFWSDAAVKILADTTSLAWRPEWQSLLSNGTVNNRASPPNNSTGIVYGDYYYLRAGNDLLSLRLANCSLGMT